MNEPVTWIMSVRNGMPFLPEALASIENQSYRNWQIIVCDHGSTDSTLAELKRWIPSHLPGRILSVDPKMPLGFCRALLLDEAETDLCAVLDQDDINLPDRLEQQVEFLCKHPEIAVLGSGAHIINEHGDLLGEISCDTKEHDDIVHTMLVRNPIIHPSVMLRRARVLKSGNYRHVPEWHYPEDYDLWLRMAATNFRLANLKHPLVKYRVHSNSMTQNAARKNLLWLWRVIPLSQNSLSLYGLPANQMLELCARRKRFALPALYAIAEHLEYTQGTTVIERLTKKSFLEAAKELVSAADVISLAALDGLGERPDKQST